MTQHRTTRKVTAKHRGRRGADSGVPTAGEGAVFTASFRCVGLALILVTSCLRGVFRPFRPRPSPDQTANDQPPAPGETPEQGEVNPAEMSQPPQTNGEVTEGQKQQQQRRQPRRRRQRNSESSTSKVRGCSIKVMQKSPRCTAPPAILIFGFSERHRKVCLRSRYPASNLQTG